MSSQSNSPNSPTPAAEGTANPAQAARYRAAFERLEAEIRAVPEDEIAGINLDVPTVITTIVGSLKELMPLRDQIAKISFIDITKIDNLRDLTDALSHTQGGYRAATGPTDPVAKLAAEVTAVRDQLYTDAHALAKRGLLDLVRVEKLRTPSGHRNIAMDVVGLASLFREHAQALVNRTPVTDAELEAGLRLAEKLMDALGERDQAPALITAAALLRQKAFTLVVNAYDEARRGIICLRWHEGDADEIAPSLWAGRTGRRPAANEAATPASTTPGTPPGSTTTPGTAAASGTGPAGAAPAAPIGVGLPGSSPFTS